MTALDFSNRGIYSSRSKSGEQPQTSQWLVVGGWRQEPGSSEMYDRTGRACTHVEKELEGEQLRCASHSVSSSKHSLLIREGNSTG